MALQLIDSRLTVLKNPRLIQFGPPECGKTVAAATNDPDFPQEIFQGKRPLKHVTLRNTLFVLFDKGGLDSLAEHNLSAMILPYRKGDRVVAEDHSGVSGGEIVPAIEQIGVDLAEAVSRLGVTTVVVDTFSTMDAVVSAYCQNKFSDEKDQRRVWGQVLGLHLRFLELLRPLPCTVIYNCHAKDVQEVQGTGAGAQADREKQETSRRASGMSMGGNIITPEITGRAFRIYLGACTLVLPILTVKTKVGGKSVSTRNYYPQGFQGLQAKNRFQSLLDEKEPVNLRLLMAKLRDRIAALPPENDDEADPSGLSVPVV